MEDAGRRFHFRLYCHRRSGSIGRCFFFLGDVQLFVIIFVIYGIAPFLKYSVGLFALT